MFDVGFWELMLIGLVALLVVGPERLPRLARTAGLWLGKGQALISQVKTDIDRELRAEELKRMLDEQKKSAGLENILEETSSVLKDASQAVNEAQSSDQGNRQPNLKSSPATSTIAKPEAGSADHGG